jgi:hypothetical protein
VNVAAEAMARAALEHREKILVTVRSLAAELQKTIEFLKTYRFLAPYPTHSNFVLCEVQVSVLPAGAVFLPPLVQAMPRLLVTVISECALSLSLSFSLFLSLSISLNHFAFSLCRA